MNKSRFDDLEVLIHTPKERPHATPLLFVHGAYTGAWCWQEHFLPFFADAGYTAYALSLSGHGQSGGREQLDSYAIADYVADVAYVINRLPTPPVIVGHSMGGFVVQKYLEENCLPGAALMCSVPPQGLMSSAFGMMFSKPGLMKELNRMMSGGQITVDTLREALFHQPVSADALTRFCRLSQPESYRAIWDMTLFGLPRVSRVCQSPLLVMGAECDHLIPASSAEMTARTYGVTAKIFPGMGHGLMLERDWRQPAEHLLAWLNELGLPA